MCTNQETKNPFIQQTALDYSMSYSSVEEIYNKYGCTEAFYNKLEEYIKERSKQ